MEFGAAISSGLSKYADFSGRASRSEFWFFFLFYILASVAASILDALLSMAIGVGSILSILLGLAALLPIIAVTIRRLHDTNRSGWWVLIAFLPLVGAILLIIWYCTKGTTGPNRFGEDPLAGQDAMVARA